MNSISQALSENRTTLSEYESKQLLSQYGIPVTKEALVRSPDELESAIADIGFPLVMKACSPAVAHKTEKNLVRLNITTMSEAESAYADLSCVDESQGVLVLEMVAAKRELMAGMTRDPQFGPCVMFGLGGIFTEALDDVVFRMAPLSAGDAAHMMDDIRAKALLGAVRGMPPVDRDALADILVNLGRIGMDNEAVKEIDINPILIADGKPVAVDALVVLNRPQ